MQRSGDWRDEARRLIQNQRQEIEARLHGGEWLALEAASEAIGIRAGRDTWRLSGYRTRGRMDLLSPDHTEIPAASWSFLTLRFDGMQFWAQSDDGKQSVYDLQVSLPPAPSGSSGSSAAGTEIERAADAQRSDDLDGFFAGMVSDGRIWRLQDYGSQLATIGLGLTDDGKRVKVSLAKGAVHRNEGGKTALATILLAFVYREQAAAGRGPIDNRSRARMALNWLKHHHPDLVKGDIRYSEMPTDFLDETHRKLRDAGFLR